MMASQAVLDAWRMLGASEAELYQGFPAHSLSVDGNPGAEGFREFVNHYAFGRVLDVGCGPQPKPLYATGLRSFYGVDPIPGEHLFPFVQAAGEALPFRDGSFDTAILATSLDHCFHHAKVIAECHRVLGTPGQLLVWTTFGSGGGFDSFAVSCTPADEHHLYRPSVTDFFSWMDGLFLAMDRHGDYFAFAKVPVCVP